MAFLNLPSVSVINADSTDHEVQESLWKNITGFSAWSRLYFATAYPGFEGGPPRYILNFLVASLPAV